MINKRTTLFSLPLGRYQFKVNLYATLGLLLGLPLLMQLGFWQLDRALQKKHILQQYDSRMHQTLALDAVNTAEDSQYYQLELQGQFDNSKQFLLDNRSFQHQIGYEVLTPFIPNGSKKALLVNRGWIARTASRDVLPLIDKMEGNRLIKGMIYYPKRTFVLKKETVSLAGWPRVIQSITLPTLSTELAEALFPFILLQDHASYPQNWTASTTSPSKHYGYAIQWFSFALIMVVIYTYVNTSKREIK